MDEPSPATSSAAPAPSISNGSASPSSLSEGASRALLAGHGVPFGPWRLAATPDDVGRAAAELGAPVAVKVSSDVVHKTELGLVALGLGTPEAAAAAARDLLARVPAGTAVDGLVVAPMTRGDRELLAGGVRDPRLGPQVVLGFGGVLADAIDRAVLRPAPLRPHDVDEMVAELDGGSGVLGAWRGEPAVDRIALRALLLGVSALLVDRPDISAIDVNPVIVAAGGHPVAVDATVQLGPAPAPATPATPAPAGPRARVDLRAALDPTGVVVVGVSQHPGKFGSAALHNVVRGGFAGPVFAVGRSGGELCGLPILPSLDDVPVGAASFAMVCVPAAQVVGTLRECSARGVRAAYVAGGGFAEEGGDGIARQAELVRTADELGIVLLGPNGQGLVSTPSLLCAQIVAPMPGSGPIGLVSQSGNIASAFQNVATGSGLGISRAVSIGNAAAVDLVDVLEALADDPATRVAVAYCEALPAVPGLVDRLAAISAAMPVVLLAGATTQAGSGAAMAHTGTAASDHRIVAGICARAGVVLVRDLEEAFDAAATLATQPLPAGRRVAVVTTAGGWGVLAADRLAEDGLELAPLSAALVADLDELLPNRWSRHNPIDLAGGERRGAVAAVLTRAAADPDVDAVLHLGLGIQANSADLIASGPFADEPDLARIVAYHRRSDVELAEAAAAASGPDGVPVLSATELAVASPGNAGVAALRAAGRYCYPTAHRAIRALAHAERHARWRRREGL